MREVAFEGLWGIALAPIGVALLLLPPARRLPRAFLVVASLAGAFAAVGFAALAFTSVRDRGLWQMLTTEGFAGARLLATGPFGEVRLAADPLSALLALVLAVVAALVVLLSSGARGGGPRASLRPLGGGQLLGLLLLTGLLQTVILAVTLDLALGAAMLASGTTWALLTASEPKREQRDAAGYLFVLHRTGDACWALALAITAVTWRTLEPTALATRLAAIDPWTVVASGPLAGFPSRAVFLVVALLIVAGVAARLPLLPLPMLYRHATGMPAPALALVQGAGGFGLGLFVLLRTLPLWERSHEATPALAALASVSAFVAALAAAGSRDLVRIDLHLLHALFALGAAAAFLGELGGAALMAAAGVVLALLLLAPTGAVLEAVPGRSDVFELGGLWRSLRRSDAARALATFGLCALPLSATWFVLERTLFEAVDGPRGSPAAALLLLGTASALTFAGFRALHLTFSGDEPRQEVPANVVEVPVWRWGPVILLALVAVVVPAVVALPSLLVGLLQEGHMEPLSSWLFPSWRALSTERLTLEGNVLDGRQGFALSWRLWGMLALSLVGAAGFVASAMLYRKGPTALHARLTAAWPLERTGGLLEQSLGLEHAFLVWLPSLVGQAARMVTTLVVVVLLDGIVTRSAGLVASLARTLLRLVHNGDVQRALFFVVLAAAVLLSLWGRP